jgi:inhibitor of KinA
MTIPSIEPMGDSSMLVAWQGLTDQAALRHVQALVTAVRQSDKPGIVDVVPAFASLTIHYNPKQIRLSELEISVQNWISRMDLASKVPSRSFEIPVCYEFEFAMDLSEISETLGMPASEIIRLHSEAEYVVQMIGFAPGFPYLSGMPSELCVARRREPRLVVPAGSVAIGGKQTGIYSLETPGGWQIIGRTPVRLFLPESDPPCLLQAGDVVRFRRISQQEFYNWQSRT